jgi:hypothetical protein
MPVAPLAIIFTFNAIELIFSALLMRLKIGIKYKI